MHAINARPFIRSGLILFSLCALLIADASAGEARAIPDPSRDRPFLYNDWRPNRPNVVAFIDPLCPYCKKAIPKFDQITDYNLFVYWAPIFGQRSEDAIRPFFRCEYPTGREVISSLLVTLGSSAVKAPFACDGELDDSRRAVNDAMVASYPINGVPAFFLQGVQTSLAQIQAVPVEPARYINGVAMDWQRYEESRIEQNTPRGSLAIILPEQQNSSVNLQLVKRYRPEYIFSRSDWQALCDALSASACVIGEDAQRARLQQYNEMVALLGIDTQSGEPFLLTLEGKLQSISAHDSAVAD